MSFRMMSLLHSVLVKLTSTYTGVHGFDDDVNLLSVLVELSGPCTGIVMLFSTGYALVMCGGNTIFVILRIEEVENWIMRKRLQEIHGDLFKYHSRKCKHLRKTDLPGKPIAGSAIGIEAYQTNQNDKRASQFNGM